jgi:VIT1/CCC1 family predicted Fe2+/Mn2+ transporter
VFQSDIDVHSRTFLLQRVQPALSGLMDGSLSTLAPIFAVVIATHRPLTAFYTGMATALGAGVSMAFSEGLSDTGDLTGRGHPVLRGAITGGGTFIGGVFHTLPFLIPGYHAALVVAVVVVAIELIVLGGCVTHSSRPASFDRLSRSPSAERSFLRSARRSASPQAELYATAAD